MDDKDKHVDLSYSYNYPVAVVFEAWTNPAWLPQWFAPYGCTIDFKKLEIRIGGSFHSCVHTPEFGDCWCIGTYMEIVPKKKIVFSMINADENGVPSDIGMHADWPKETLVTVTFSEENGKTIVKLNQTAPERVARKTGAYYGWCQMFERMEMVVEQI